MENWVNTIKEIDLIDQKLINMLAELYCKLFKLIWQKLWFINHENILLQWWNDIYISKERTKQMNWIDLNPDPLSNARGFINQIYFTV